MKRLQLSAISQCAATEVSVSVTAQSLTFPRQSLTVTISAISDIIKNKLRIHKKSIVKSFRTFTMDLIFCVILPSCCKDAFQGKRQQSANILRGTIWLKVHARHRGRYAFLFRRHRPHKQGPDLKYVQNRPCHRG